MVFIENIVMSNCRLCHAKPGLHDINADKKFIKDIYDCIRIKVSDKTQELLPSRICEECKKTIKCFSLFKQHIRKVDQCLKKLIKLKTLEPQEKQFKCEQCPAEFKSEDVFKNHVSSHIVVSNSEEAVFNVEIPCSVCNKIFTSLEEYGSHLCHVNSINFGKESHEELQRDCLGLGDNRDFNSDFEDNPDGQSTTRLIKNEKCLPYICSFKNCKKVLNSAYSLKTHLLIHQGVRSFLCVTCGKGFMTKNSLTCHEKIHLEVKGYMCKLCNIGFSVRSNLRAHEKKHHEGVRFYCSQCPKSFSSKCSLERHERIHTGIRDFKCQTCPSAFYTRKELLKHQRYHQGVRAHKCDECFKAFFERHHLIIHLRSHTGERPYVCKFLDCGKSFTESQKLKRHHNAKHAQV